MADVNAVIASGESESAMLRRFETIFDRYAPTCPPLPAMRWAAMRARSRRGNCPPSPGPSRPTSPQVRPPLPRIHRRPDPGGRSARYPERGRGRGDRHPAGPLALPRRFPLWAIRPARSCLQHHHRRRDMLLAERSRFKAMLDARGRNIDQLSADPRHHVMASWRRAGWRPARPASVWPRRPAPT